MQCGERNKTQNYGVVVQGEHESQAVDFYGVLNDIIQLTYSGESMYIYLNVTGGTLAIKNMEYV